MKLLQEQGSDKGAMVHLRGATRLSSLLCRD